MPQITLNFSAATGQRVLNAMEHMAPIQEDRDGVPEYEPTSDLDRVRYGLKKMIKQLVHRSETNILVEQAKQTVVIFDDLIT